MSWKTDRSRILTLVGGFLACLWLPVGWARFDGAILEALFLVKWYAREHVLLCLVPAFFIAGAIGVFISQASVMKYLGAGAHKVLAYGVASVSGSILAVCSCTVLPLFAGIWRMGAGLGPACAFLYSGPAINVLAIILTARILGPELGFARAVGAILFSIIIGLLMHLFFRKEEQAKAVTQAAMPEPEVVRPLWQNAVFFGVMIALLVFANWSRPDERFNIMRVTRDGGRQLEASGRVLAKDGQLTRFLVEEVAPSSGTAFAADKEIRIDLKSETSDGAQMELEPIPSMWASIYHAKWWVVGGCAVALGLILAGWFGVSGWKLALVAVAPVVLAWTVPTDGLWVLVPFSAGMAGLSMVLARDTGEGGEWLGATWAFAKQIMPLLFFGVLAAGFFLGRPGHEGIIPSRYVEMLVGHSPDTFLSMTGLEGGAFESVMRAMWPLWTNLFASVFGAFMYFATLTEVPILQGLIGAGMGKGPALALLLAGPALSLPNMLVIRSIMGTKKTVVFVTLVVFMATVSGLIFGAFFD